MDKTQPRIAYVVSRFPKVTETFIVREIHAAIDAGVDVDVYSLLYEEQGVVQSEADSLMDRVTWGNRLPTSAVLAAVGTWLLRRPVRTLSLSLTTLLGNLRSPSFLVRAIVTVPVAMAFALRMERDRVEHLHAHWATHPALAAWVIHQLTGIPYSVTVHAHDLYVERAMLETKLSDATAVVTISEFNRSMLLRIDPTLADRLHVIRCGVVVPDRDPDRARASGLVVCVASLQEYKGHRYFIEAVALLAREGRELTVLLVGDGELRSELERDVEAAGLTKVIRFLGHQPSERVHELLEEATVVVQPSVVTSAGKMEGIPVALMEAMATGAAVVASDISGISELVEDDTTGLLVPQRDPTALALAIADLLDDDRARQRLGCAARQRVADQFELRHNSALLLPLLVSDLDGS